MARSNAGDAVASPLAAIFRIWVLLLAFAAPIPRYASRVCILSGLAALALIAVLPAARAQDATYTVMTVSPDPFTTGQLVYFTATVRETSDNSFASGPICIYLEFASGGSPTGGPVCGTVPSSGGNIGTYAFNFNGLPAGTYHIWAEFAGTSAYAPSTSPVLVRSTAKGATTTTLTSSLNPSIETQAVTFTAAVTSSVGPTPAGNMEFRIDGGLVGTVALNGSGQATYTTSALAVGSRTITASYLGDAAHNTSSATPLTQHVDPAPTVTITPATLPDGQVGAAYNQALTASGGTVSYTFTHTAGTLPPGIALNSDGTLTGTAMAAGTYNFTARATDANGFYGERAYALVISLGIATPTITSSLNPSQLGDSVTFTATVAGGGAIPTGTVSFSVNGGAVTIVPLAGGVATFTTSTLSGGSHTIYGAYGGDANYTPSDTSITQTVNRIPTTTTLVSSLNPSAPGDNVTFTATVVATSGGGTPTGTVSFIADGATLATVAIDAAGIATFSTSTLAVGNRAMGAVYSGDATHHFSGDSLTQAVGQIGTVTTVVSSLNPSNVGDAVTFTATATPHAGSTPLTGSFYFTVDGASAATVSVDASGTASFSTSTLTAGLHNVTASYSGDMTYTSSAGGVAQSVVPAGQVGTTLTLVSSLNPSNAGDTVTFTATVAAISGGGVPTGTVAFEVDGTTAATIGLDALGAASFSVSNLAPGFLHAVTATYSGAAAYAPSTDTVTQSVAFVPGRGTSTALVSSLNPSNAGDTVTFTATVTPHIASAPLTGAFYFTIDGTWAATVNIDAAGTASFSTSTLTLGTHQVTASYSGNVDYDSSATSLTQTVGQAGTTLVLTSSANPSTAGDPVIVTATVTSASGVTPTGFVTFAIDGATAATATLDTAGAASFTASTLTPGTHSITATYAGDAAHTGSNGTLTQVVDQIATSVALASSANPSNLGSSVTFTATVTAAGGGAAPGGTVTFSIDGIDQAPATLSGGQASLATSTLGVGSHEIAARYDGDTAHIASASSPLWQEVIALGSIVVRQTIDGADASFAFTSPTPELNFSVATSGGAGESMPASLPAGAYVVTAADMRAAGYALTSIACNDADSVGDVAGRTATINLAAGESVVCTFASADTRTRTTGMIGEFMEQRASLILQNQPDIQRRIDRLNGTAGGSGDAVRTLLGYLPELATGVRSFSTSLAAVRKLSGDVQPGRFDAWFEGAYARVGEDSDFGLATLGADWLVNRNLLLGGFVQMDAMEMEGRAGGSVEGIGWLAGPYLTARVTENLFLDLLAGAGGSSNRISPYGTYTDGFDATRWLASASLQGQWDYGAWRFSPRTRLSYFTERSGAYTDSLGVRIGSVRTSLGQFAFGPGFSRRHELDNGVVLDASLRFDGVLDFKSTSTSGDETDFSGRIEAGLDATMPGGANLGLTAMYGGIGGDEQHYGGKLRISIPLN